MPLATAATFSKAQWIHGTSHDVYGNMVVETSKHPVAFVTIVGPLVAFITCLATMVSSQPAHRRPPQISASGFLAISFKSYFAHFYSLTPT